ncbi:MAG: hypothetical protein U5O39_05195 [Gammaproteobacteria bacterium]|nr:hypothetical protein [Gammaproteobacteria bacterium]
MAVVPTRASEMTAPWLSEVLTRRGLLRSEVTAVECETIGEGVGLMADLSRLRLTYAGKEELPATMVAKTAASSENRAVAQLLDFYNREVNFYNQIGQQCPMRVPLSYYGNVNDDTYDLALLLEDLGDVSPIDQITGATEAEAYDKVSQIAKLHAMFWNRVDEDEFDWMYDIQGPEELVKAARHPTTPRRRPASTNSAISSRKTAGSCSRRSANSMASCWSRCRLTTVSATATFARTISDRSQG